MTYTAPTETGEAETTSGDAGGGIDAAAFEGMRVGRNDPCPAAVAKIQAVPRQAGLMAG